MSLLYKRPGSPYWYVTKTRQSTKTVNRKDAEAFARKTLSAHWHKETLGEESRTWEALCADWEDFKSGKASIEEDRRTMKRFGALLARRGITELADITADVVAAYGREVKAEASAATANRHFTTLRAMLNRAAAKWKIPAPTIENYEVIEAEAAWLTIEQVNGIVPHLPDWVADMFLFGVETGMRFSNIAGLRWDWIRADGKVAVIPAGNTKTRRTYTVPLSTAAQAIITRLRALSRDPVYVFVGRRRTGDHTVYVDYAPVTSVRPWWDAARDKAGLDVTWHEATRHTFATMHTKNKTPDRILAKMGGWASTRMLARYGHHEADDLIAYADNARGHHYVNSGEVSGTPAGSKLSLDE